MRWLAPHRAVGNRAKTLLIKSGRLSGPRNASDFPGNDTREI